MAKFKDWKSNKEFEEVQGKYTESGKDFEQEHDNPYGERIQESDDPAADCDVENPEWFQDIIEWRRKDKRNTSIFVLGAPRAGKSYTALTLGEVTDSNGDFDVDNHVVMHTADFVRKINEFPEGCNIVYDEGGAGHSSRRFMSKMNIMMNAVLQTFGSRYINVVWTVPNMKMEDVTARQLCTFSIRMIARGKGIVYSHWSDVHTGKPFWKRLGAYVQFDKPFRDKPKQLKLYEKMKREYQKEMYEGIARELDMLDMQETESVKLKDPNYLTEEIRKNIDDFMTDRGNINVWAVKAAFQGAPMTSIYTAKELLKQKYGIGKVLGANLKTLAGNSPPPPSFSAPAYSPPGAEVQPEPDGSVGLRQTLPGNDDSPEWVYQARNLNNEVPDLPSESPSKTYSSPPVEPVEDSGFGLFPSQKPKKKSGRSSKSGTLSQKYGW
tara:strand:- start:207 stop:1517 length:1311 start_codon:yes stop_codon:yes gene_type:complete